jgi:phosphatidylglycerol:prolipoprotein diacylglycerol transferase
MIALGLLIFARLVYRHPNRKTIIADNQLFDLLLLGIIAGVGGARLLYLASNWSIISTWTDSINLWSGGLSMLGALLGSLLVIPWFARRHAIPLLPLLDIFALYAPLFESICRLGCFFAGCCFGKATSVIWAITYTDPESAAPLNIALHPTQLYASLTSLIVFFFIYYGLQRIVSRPGQLLAAYLVCTSIERFTIDFLRADQEFFSWPLAHFFSIHQWIALGIAACAAIGYAITNVRYAKPTHK